MNHFHYNLGSDKHYQKGISRFKTNTRFICHSAIDFNITIWYQVCCCCYQITLFIFIFILDILKSVLNSIENDPKSWIYSIIIGGITFYIVKFYYKVKQYPSGPFPLPIVGSLFSKKLNNTLIYLIIFY